MFAILQVTRYYRYNLGINTFILYKSPAYNQTEHIRSSFGSECERLHFDYSNFTERSAPGNLVYDPS